LEATLGVEAFTGRSLDRAHGPTLGRAAEHLPKPIQDWLGYTKTNDAAGRPKYEFDGRKYHLLVRSWAFSRFFSTSDRQFREYLDDGLTLDAFVDMGTDIALGIRNKTINMNEQQEILTRRKIRESQEANIRRGNLKRFQTAYVPKSE